MARQRPAWRCYAAAGLMIALAAGLSGWVLQTLGPHVPYVIFFPAVALAALYGGWRGGLLASGLSAAILSSWAELRSAPHLSQRADWLALGVFLLSCLLLTAIGESLFRARRRAERAEAEARTQAAVAAERQRVEAALRENEQRLRILVAATFEGIAISEQGCFVDVNDQMARMLGYTRTELLGRKVADFVAPEDQARVLEKIQTGAESHIEHEMLHRSGTRLVVEAHGQTVEMGGRHLRFTAVRDVTAPKRFQQTLFNQNRRLDLLNEAAARLLAMPDSDQAMAGIYQRIAGYFHTSGYIETELTPAGTSLRIRASHGVGETPTDCPTLELPLGEGILGQVAQRRRPMYLGHVQRTDNPAAQRLKALGVRAYACFPLVAGSRLLGTLSFGSGERDTFEPEDQEFFETLASYLAMAKERARLTRELHAYAESLESKVEERTAKLQELVAELQHMAYSIMHDLRAPLRAIEGYATLIQKAEGPHLSARSLDFFQRMVTATGRMDQLITDALNYNRAVRQEWPLGPVDLGKLLQDLVKTYPEWQPPQAEIQLEGPFPKLLANPAGLTQCFSNLLSNAVKFVAPGVKPHVRVWTQEMPPAARNPAHAVPGPPSPLSPRQAAKPVSAAAGPVPGATAGVVRIWVEDNGTGVPKTEQATIFDMFRRMHGPEYEGTGIGLALVRKVTEHMGGRVGVESEEGHGSRFWVELALAEDRTELLAA